MYQQSASTVANAVNPLDSSSSSSSCFIQQPGDGMPDSEAFNSTNAKFNMFNALSAAAANFAANFTSSPAASTSSYGSQFAIPTAPNFTSPSAAASTSLPIPISQFGPSTKRERTKYTESQLAYLDGIFRQTHYPDVARREEIAQLLHLTDVKVQVWFKNRRAKMRNEKKIEQLKREASKVGATPKAHGNGKNVIANANGGMMRKCEESVEDTEEEDQHGGKLAKVEASVDDGKAKKGIQSGKSSMTMMETVKKEDNKPLQHQPIGLLPLDAQCATPFLPFYNFPKVECPPSNGIHNSSNGTTFMPNGCPSTASEMGTLMQHMASVAAFPHSNATQNNHFYAGWSPSAAANYSPILASSSYPNAAGQMFGHLAVANSAAAAAASSYYHPSSHYGSYYFPAQMAQQQPD